MIAIITACEKIKNKPWFDKMQGIVNELIKEEIDEHLLSAVNFKDSRSVSPDCSDEEGDAYIEQISENAAYIEIGCYGRTEKQVLNLFLHEFVHLQQMNRGEEFSETTIDQEIKRLKNDYQHILGQR